MAKTTYQTMTPEQLELYSKGLCSGDRFILNKVRRNNTLLSRRRKKGLSQRSLLPQCAEAWATLSDAEKLDWAAAGDICNMKGWNLFVKDKCLRIVNDMPGVATPNLLHQALVGKIVINSPATEISLFQPHPHTYWVSKKVYGKKGMYEPVIIEEDLALPLSVSLNYKSNLEAAGPSPYARLYAEVWKSYQGVDGFVNALIDLDFVTDWKSASAVLSSVIGHFISYNLYIVLHDLRGVLYFDNIKSIHSGQNWARDTFCNDIDQNFTRAFYQVPKHWVALNLPAGSEFGSVYEDI
jgi:hypothetical protein